MDKLKLAHEMALAIQGTKLIHDMELVSEMAWKYADAMQAEADKRNKAEAEQKRKEIREMLNADNTFLEKEGQHFDDVADIQKPYTSSEEWQPDWSKAPDGYNWWSVDENGTANFSGKKPHIEGQQWVYYSAAGENPCHIEAPSFNYQGNWQDSLRERPHGL